MGVKDTDRASTFVRETAESRDSGKAADEVSNFY
jgi:hypothetical protein